MSPAPQTRIDAEQLDLMLLALRLPAIRALWKNFRCPDTVRCWISSTSRQLLARPSNTCSA